jgi:hypothetical protein
MKTASKPEGNEGVSAKVTLVKIDTSELGLIPRGRYYNKV